MDIIMRFLDELKKICPIIEEIKNKGGIPYLVGGSIRDLVLKKSVKDFDIEVHKLSLDELEKCLRKFGEVSLIGKQFGVLKLYGTEMKLGDKVLPIIDWSLPRKDSKGRKPQIIIDSDLSIEDACKRRDVTMNAMAIDLSLVCDRIEDLCQIVSKEGDEAFDVVKHFEVIDPYGGLNDIRDKVLRFVDKKLFVEDPLRFYRVMQFVARFEMVPDQELNKVCKEIDLREAVKGGELARERIYEEIKKLFLKSKRPSLGFRWVADIGRLQDLFPELAALVNIVQRQDYHPEGNVFEHTMQCIDAAADLPVTDDFSEEDKFMIMLAVLCHDLGKVKRDPEGGAKGHEKAGVPLTKKLLRRFTWSSRLIRAISKLVRYHMMPLVLVEQESSLKAYKRLALKLAPEVSLHELYLVVLADIRGRNKDCQEPLSEDLLPNRQILDTFLEHVKEAQVEYGPEEPVLLGRDLLGIIEPGPRMGLLLKKAYQIQIDEGIKDKEVLKERVLKGDKSRGKA